MTEKVMPEIADDVFIAPGAFIIGNVKIDSGSSVWPSAVIRGDKEPITIGKNTSIQDNVTIHTSTGNPVVIGYNVTVGHNAVIHGAKVEDLCIIGMGATLLDGAVIGRGSIVGANALVTSGTKVPPNSLVLGVPAKVVKEGDFIKATQANADEYVELTKAHLEGRFGFVRGD